MYLCLLTFHDFQVVHHSRVVSLLNTFGRRPTCQEWRDMGSFDQSQSLDQHAPCQGPLRIRTFHHRPRRWWGIVQSFEVEHGRWPSQGPSLLQLQPVTILVCHTLRTSVLPAFSTNRILQSRIKISGPDLSLQGSIARSQNDCQVSS